MRLKVGVTMEKRKLEGTTPRVVLMGYTQTVNHQGPDAIVAAAGKLCYSKVGSDTILNSLSETDIQKFINNLASIGHESPFEHASFNFYIEGISRACSHQIVRHRIASYSQQSQRYVDLNETFRVIIPPAIQENEKATELYLDSIEKDYNAYIDITEALLEDYVKKALAEGKTLTPREKNQLKKKALEDARFALPNACETKIMMTMNARSLFNFFKERLCTRAQWEIREVANQMLDQVLEVAPNIFMNAGAPCVFGKCPEGKMSCGHPQEMKEKQKTIHKQMELLKK